MWLTNHVYDEPLLVADVLRLRGDGGFGRLDRELSRALLSRHLCGSPRVTRHTTHAYETLDGETMMMMSERRRGTSSPAVGWWCGRPAALAVPLPVGARTATVEENDDEGAANDDGDTKRCGDAPRCPVRRFSRRYDSTCSVLHRGILLVIYLFIYLLYYRHADYLEILI